MPTPKRRSIQKNRAAIHSEPWVTASTTKAPNATIATPASGRRIDSALSPRPSHTASTPSANRARNCGVSP